LALAEWEEQARRALDRKLAKYEKAVAKSLRGALDNMRAEMTRLYERYAVAGKLTHAEMTRYNRLRTAEKQIIAALDPALRATVAEVRRLRPEMYGEAYFRYAWTLDNASGVRLNWGQLNRAALVETLANTIDELSLTKGYPANARLRIRQAISNGLTMGKSYPQMARDLKGAMNTTLNNALRIVRTEGQYAQNAGHSDVYLKARELGIEGTEIWVATVGDIRTRPTHVAMHNVPRNEDGRFDGPGDARARYPGDWELPAEERINCRCTMRFEIEGYAPVVERRRDKGLVPPQGYASWKADHPTWRSA